MEKIDRVIAAIMTMNRGIRCGNDTGASVYDSRWPLFVQPGAFSSENIKIFAFDCKNLIFF